MASETISDKMAKIIALLRCPLCNCIMENPKAVDPCGHIFCSVCINAAIEAEPIPQRPDRKLPLCSHGTVGDVIVVQQQPEKGSHAKLLCPTCRGPAFKWCLRPVVALQRLLTTYRSLLDHCQ